MKRLKAYDRAGLQVGAVAVAVAVAWVRHRAPHLDVPLCGHGDNYEVRTQQRQLQDAIEKKQ